MSVGSLTFKKEERLCSKTLIDRLFNGGGSRSMAAFPLRMVYMPVELMDKEPPVRVMISVPKRCFKRAVKRNRVKRQVREAYRHCKNVLWQKLQEKQGRGLLVAFIWLDDKLRTTDEVASRVENLLQRLAEKTDLS